MATLNELSGPPAQTGTDPDMWLLTGNHYIAIPRIARADGGLHGINVLHRGLNGLLEWAGDATFGTQEATADATPLLRFAVTGGDTRAADAPLDWQLLDGWIPSFRTRRGKLRVTGTLCTPGSIAPLLRGAVLTIELANEGVNDQTVEVALEGVWQWSLLSIATARPLAGRNRLLRAPGVDALVLEAGADAAGAALAVCAGYRGGSGVTAGADVITAAADPGGAWDAGTADRSATLQPLAPGATLEAANGTALRFRLGRRITLPPRRRATLTYYLGVGAERDGAVATAAALRRTGAEELIHVARLDLARFTRRSPDTAAGALLQRNLLYAFHSSVARAVDDDLLYPVLSRSLAHGATALVGERAALLWSLPALLLVDAGVARELLLRLFEQYSLRAGEQWKYLDGSVLAPGLQLDQICAYPLALDHYVQTTGDETVLAEPAVQETLRDLDELLYSLLDSEAFLCASELLPSGERADHDFPVHGNVLAWQYAEALPRVWRAVPDEPAARFAEAAGEIASAIWQRCTADIDGAPLLGYTSDLNGGVAVYDDPDGSLALLPALGFCEATDPIWSDTLELLRSHRYPLWIGDAPFPGLARRSAPGVPRLAALCADLLGPRRDAALDVLKRLRLPGGVAAEAYHARTGTAAEAPFAAALAGCLAWSLERALRPAAPPPATRRRR